MRSAGQIRGSGAFVNGRWRTGHGSPVRAASPPAVAGGKRPWIAPLAIIALLLLATAEPGHPPGRDLPAPPRGEPDIVFCYGESRAICQRFPRRQLAQRTG